MVFRRLSFILGAAATTFCLDCVDSLDLHEPGFVSTNLTFLSYFNHLLGLGTWCPFPSMSTVSLMIRSVNKEWHRAFGERGQKMKSGGG